MKVKVQKSGVVGLLCLLSLIGCRGGGGFQDIALVKQAQKELRSIRNALEEYKIDHGTYPPEGSDLKMSLAPYLSKSFYSEGENAPHYMRVVLGAQNTLTQIKNAISGCERVKEPRIKATFTHLQELLKSYELILSGKDEEILPLSGEISKLSALIDSLNPTKCKSLNRDSLIRVSTQIIEVTDSLMRNAKDKELTHLNNINTTFQWYKAKLTGKAFPEEVERYSPEGELSALKGITHESTIILLQELINYYYELESYRDYYDFLLTTQADLKRALKVVSVLEEAIPEAKKSAVIVQAQASLHRMADALRDYGREKGSFPNPDVNIDSILRPYFIETTMSGEQIDRWKEVLSWLSRGPIYRTKDPNTEFEIEAWVNNEARTHIISKVRVQNQWDEIVKAFAGPPIYTTPDPTHTYFLKARARDSGLTWVTERPPLIEKKGEI